MGDIQQHLAGFHTLTGDLLRKGEKHAVHLDRQRPRLRLTLTLTAGALAKAGQILLSDRQVPEMSACAGAGIVHKDLEMHLRFAAKTFDVGKKVALIGPDGAAQRVIVLKGGSKAKRQD